MEQFAQGVGITSGGEHAQGIAFVPVQLLQTIGEEVADQAVIFRVVVQNGFLFHERLEELTFVHARSHVEPCDPIIQVMREPWVIHVFVEAAQFQGERIHLGF